MNLTPEMFCAAADVARRVAYVLEDERGGPKRHFGWAHWAKDEDLPGSLYAWICDHSARPGTRVPTIDLVSFGRWMDKPGLSWESASGSASWSVSWKDDLGRSSPIVEMTMFGMAWSNVKGLSVNDPWSTSPEDVKLFGAMMEAASEGLHRRGAP